MVRTGGGRSILVKCTVPFTRRLLVAVSGSSTYPDRWKWKPVVAVFA